MAARDSSGVKRRRARMDGNPPRTHPQSSGRKAGKPRSAPAERIDADGDELAEALSKLSTAAQSNASLKREARKPYREPRAKTKAPGLDEPLLPAQVLYQLDEAISLVICAKVATDVVTMDRDPLISAGHVGVVLEHACTALRAAYDRVDRALGEAS